MHAKNLLVLRTHRNILDTQLDLAERLVLVIVQVGKRQLENTALERVVGVACTSQPLLLAPSSVTAKYARRPCERLTRVLPTLRFSKNEGALMSYQSGVSFCRTLRAVWLD